jgi:hypothetical protein
MFRLNVIRYSMLFNVINNHQKTIIIQGVFNPEMMIGYALLHI